MADGRIKLIITTRYVPFGWPNGVGLDWDVDLLDIPDNDNKKKFKANPAVKSKGFGIYDVYVVPCLEKGVDSKQKGECLEKIIVLTCPDLEYKNVYLCAHDNDFNVDRVVYGELVKKDNVLCDGCHQLMELVERKHAYMFAHDEDKSAVGEIVMKLEDPKWGEKECNSLISIIDAERDMYDFFASINDNTKSYPLAT